MPFCSKCGKELIEGQDFCDSCGNQKGNNIKPFNKKHVYIGLAVIVSLLIFYFIFVNSSGTGNVVNNSPKECTFECCLSGEYQQKICQQDYECISNICKPIDSDKDGLSDIEEKQLGTNPQLFDTDGDTLSDYKETKDMRTNPLKMNTDGDRYNDNLDNEPLQINSALINLQINSMNWNWKYGNIILAFIGGSLVNPDLTIAEPTTSISIKNVGDDYTDYVTYDIYFKVSNVLLATKNVQLARIDSNEENLQVYMNPITAGDVPDLLINAIMQQTTDWKIETGNLDYEKF